MTPLRPHRSPLAGAGDVSNAIRTYMPSSWFCLPSLRARRIRGSERNVFASRAHHNVDCKFAQHTILNNRVCIKSARCSGVLSQMGRETREVAAVSTNVVNGPVSPEVSVELAQWPVSHGRRSALTFRVHTHEIQWHLAYSDSAPLHCALQERGISVLLRAVV